MRILVSGGSGLLGSAIAIRGRGRHEIFATYQSNPLRIDGTTALRMDIVKESEVIGAVRKIRPDAVIHAAALVNADYCEDHHGEAIRINTEGTKNVARACAEAGAKMVYVSTDYVFDGARGKYAEEDAPNPINFYGETKLAAEKVVRETLVDWAIGRVSVIYGEKMPDQRDNFVIWVRDSLMQGKEIKVVTDQFNSPTYAPSGADALLALIKKEGIYHVAGPDCTNRYDFACRVADAYSLEKNRIIPITSDVLNQRAPRPRKNCLDVGKALRELDAKLVGIDEGLARMKEKVDVDG